jgi:hypothetical protein
MSEIIERQNPENRHSYGGGETTMDCAVRRQQNIIANYLLSEEHYAVSLRAAKLDRYLALLGNASLRTGPEVTEEFNELALVFYRSCDRTEEGLIQDAGGMTYGI